MKKKIDGSSEISNEAFGDDHKKETWNGYMNKCMGCQRAYFEGD